MIVQFHNISMMRFVFDMSCHFNCLQKPITIKWWNRTKNVDICMRNDRRFIDAVVPLSYRLESDTGICSPYTLRKNSANVTQFQIDQLMNAGANTALFLVERGYRFQNRSWHDYLVWAIICSIKYELFAFSLPTFTIPMSRVRRQ